LFYDRNVFPVINNGVYNDIAVKLNVLEFLFVVFNRSLGKKGIIVRSEKLQDKKAYFINKFIKSKIEKYLTKGSAVIKITDTVILIFMDNGVMEKIHELVKEYRIVTQEIIETETFKPGDFKDVHFLLNKCI